MSNPSSATEEADMKTIRVFEPALCCNTGVCGTDVDQSLVTFTADLDYLKQLGVDIERHNLANEPLVFAENDSVRAFLQVAGSEGLPLTLVDGITVATGSYPSREQLINFVGTPTGALKPVGLQTLTMAGDGDGCACGSSGCC